MARHSGSILRKLEAGFGLSAVLLAGLMALFMDRALHRSLEAEDAQVMEGQVRALLRQVEAGLPLLDPDGGPRPEKAAWRLLDGEGRVLSQSADLAAFPLGVVLDPKGGAQEIEIAGRGVYSVLARSWSRGRDQGTLLLVMDRTHEEAIIHGFRRTLLLGVITAVIAAALLARAIARWGLAPLAAIAREADSISDRNLDRRLASEHFPRELQELVATLNAALSRLQAAFERVGNLGAELAHELRTPLQNLRSTLENRVVRSGGTPVPPADLGGLIEDCDRMAALIEQILFLARQDQAPPTGTQTLVAVGGLLEEVRGFFEAAAEAARVELRVDTEPGLAVPGDPLMLTRALHNLTSNAIRHTPPGGGVVLTAHAEDSKVWLGVVDTGPGIPEAWIADLGTPFFRPPGGRGTGGHGLGLAIVKRIARMLGGEMRIERGTGGGTRVGLRLPGA